MAMRHRLLFALARAGWHLRRPRTLGVRAVVLDAAGDVALVRHTYLPGWYLPGGGVERGESMAAALGRELREEVALAEWTLERMLGLYHSRRDGKDDHVAVMVVRTATRRPPLVAADPREIAEVGWFAVDAPPPDVSAATARRLAEQARGATGAGDW